MYNRYIQSDHGVYSPIPEEHFPPFTASTKDPATQNILHADQNLQGEKKEHIGHSLDSARKFFTSFSKLRHWDSGDLFLLAMLFFLYRENADDELLFALGLLLFL